MTEKGINNKMGSVISNSKEQFFNHLINSKDIVRLGVFTVLKEKYLEFYDVCKAFADISLNAPKYRLPGTCDIQGSFQFSDIEIAKNKAKNFYEKNAIDNMEEYLFAIKELHRLAVEFDDPRCTGGRVMSENNNFTFGTYGKYYNFAEIPLDIWNQIENDVKEYIQNP